MKKGYFLFICLIAFFASNSQTVSVFTNLNISTTSVIGSGRYHVSESIYTDAELGSSNFITTGSAIQKVYFYLYIQGTNTTVNNYRISMKNVAAATTTFTSGTYNTTGYTVVYNGSFTATPVGYVGVTLTTPFVRAAGTNLQVMIERTDNVTHSGYQFIESEGNASNPNAFTTRAYNGNAALNIGTTNLTASISRPGMRFVHTYPNDAAVRNIISPTVSCYDGTQTIAVQVSNLGSNAIPIGAAAVTLKLSGVNPFEGTLTNTTAIAAGSSAIINFTNIDLSVPGDNIDTAFVNLTGENYRVNDTLVSYTSTASVLSSYPIVEDAESNPLLVFGYADAVVGNTQLWTLQSDFYTNEDMNPVTAPSSTWDTIRPRATGNTFYLFDSYNGASTSISRLFSNCISMPAPTPSNPTPITTISFWMSHDSLFSTSYDSLFLTVSTDKGLTWTRILPGFRRTDVTAAGPYWKEEVVNLSAYNGQTIQIGFEGVSEFGNAFALDDININYTGLVPVSVLSLNATRNGRVNNLHWITSNQVNTHKFIVERSKDGINFSSIGQVNAATTNNITEDYFFVDATPAKGINYYRIKMVDIDNSYKLSVVRNVKNLGVAELSVNPNPVLQTMRINIEAENTENAVLVVSDLTGKKIISKNIMVTAGANNIEIPAGQLSKGTYVVAIRLSNQTLVQRISKM